jgi:hypothetical protein
MNKSAIEKQKQEQLKKVIEASFKDMSDIEIGQLRKEFRNPTDIANQINPKRSLSAGIERPALDEKLRIPTNILSFMVEGLQTICTNFLDEIRIQ